MDEIAEIECYICDRIIKPTLILKNIKHEWHIVRCPLCNVTFVHPQPDPETISSYYNGMYSDLATKYDELKMLWATKSIAGYLSTLSKHKQLNKDITLLDLGGGLGYYSKAFIEAGLAVTLVEQDPVSVEFARSVLNIVNVIEASVEDFFQLNNNKYDIIFLRHVIEHSANPSNLINEVGNSLADGGILVIETDNNSGIELLFRPGTAAFYLNLYRSSYLPCSFLSLIKRRPFAVDPPRHLFGFRISNLSELLMRSTLTPIETKCYRLGHPVYWPNLPLPELRDILSDIRHFEIKRIASKLIDVAVFPFRLFLEYVGLASGLCIYAIKDSSRINEQRS